MRTDHYTLKFMLDQRLSTIPQHQWISKLFGFNFTVEYRPGRVNVVADALSRRDQPDKSLQTISDPTFQLYKDIRTELDSNEELRNLRGNVSQLRGPDWCVHDGLILNGSRVFVPASSPHLPTAIQLAHTVGHEGIQKTLHRLRRDFVIDGDRAIIRDFVRACSACQRNKTETLQPAGLLQPLQVPSQIWADISLDFIEGLPKVHGKSVILTAGDKFSKYAHFIPLSHPYTAASVAISFFSEIVKLHGFSSSIVSGCDPIFTSHVWRDLFKLAGVKLCMSTTFHPQTDGQSEAVNKTIAMYLRCITGDRSRAWLDWLPWAEYCYNTSFHSALRATPFQVVYGRLPPPLLPYVPDTTTTSTVDTLLQDRDSFLHDVHECLHQAQQYAKKQYDAHHRELELSIGSWVWLRLLHRPVQTLVLGKRGKLSPRYVGPYQIVERIGALAYRLKLPDGARIHNVFHIRVLKPFIDTLPATTLPLPPIQHGRLLQAPEKALRSQRRHGHWHILIQWFGLPIAAATWERVDEFREAYLEFQLEDELFREGESGVMSSKKYARHQPATASG